MLYAYVRRFDVMDTVGKFLGTKHGGLLLAITITRIQLFVMCSVVCRVLFIGQRHKRFDCCGL